MEMKEFFKINKVTPEKKEKRNKKVSYLLCFFIGMRKEEFDKLTEEIKLLKLEFGMESLLIFTFLIKKKSK